MLVPPSLFNSIAVVAMGPRQSGRYPPGSRRRDQGYTGATGWGRSKAQVRKRPAQSVDEDIVSARLILPGSRGDGTVGGSSSASGDGGEGGSRGDGTVGGSSSASGEGGEGGSVGDDQVGRSGLAAGEGGYGGDVVLLSDSVGETADATMVAGAGSHMGASSSAALSADADNSAGAATGVSSEAPPLLSPRRSSSQSASPSPYRSPSPPSYYPSPEPPRRLRPFG